MRGIKALPLVMIKCSQILLYLNIHIHSHIFISNTHYLKYINILHIYIFTLTSTSRISSIVSLHFLMSSEIFLIRYKK